MPCSERMIIMPKVEQITSKTSPQISRRASLASLAAVAGAMAVPLTARADADTPTKADTARLSFEISNYKYNTSKFQRRSQKTNTINEDSTDSQYPSASALYSYIEKKGGMQQGTKEEGHALFVGSNGNIELKDYVVDTELKENSSNPVQSKVLYKIIKELNESLIIDEKPMICNEHDGHKTIKHVVTSGNIYKTYQMTEECTSLANCEMGVNYRYNAYGISNSTQNWGVKKIDTNYLALCDDEFGIVYNSTTGADGSWEAPDAIWHS